MRLAALAGGIGALVLLAWISAGTPSPAPFTLTSAIDIRKATLPELQKLKDRTIVDFGTNPDGTVSYSYLDQKVPEQLAPHEVPELRTGASYTVYEGSEGVGTDVKVRLKTIIYAQPAYAKDVDGSWRTLEYATTTEQAFRERSQTIWDRVAELIVRTAYADSVSPFSGAGDGGVSYSGSEEALVSCAGQSTGSTATPTTNTISASAFNDTTPGAFLCTISRGFLPFSTASIPTAATISDATLNIFVTAKQDQDNDGDDYVTVVQTTQVDETTLATGDYSKVGSSSGVTGGLDITSITTSAYNALALNSTGLAWIAKSGQSSACGVATGVTCLGLRVGHDITGVGLATLSTNSVTLRASEFTGTSNDPYLSITYTVPQAVLAGGVWIGGGGGRLNVVGGGLKILR